MYNKVVQRKNNAKPIQIYRIKKIKQKEFKENIKICNFSITKIYSERKNLEKFVHDVLNRKVISYEPSKCLNTT